MARDDYVLERRVPVKKPGAVIHLLLSEHEQQRSGTENNIVGITAQDDPGLLHTEIAQRGVKAEPEGSQETRKRDDRISGKTEESNPMRELPAFLRQTEVRAARRNVRSNCLPNINLKCSFHPASSFLAGLPSWLTIMFIRISDESYKQCLSSDARRRWRTHRRIPKSSSDRENVAAAG